MQAQLFISTVAPESVAAQKAHGILASVSIAQIALETGWLEHAPGNNVGGIKADSNWHGSTQVLTTEEFIWATQNGKRVEEEVEEKCLFRAYPTLAAGIADHAAFLVENSRYKNIIGQKNYKVTCVDLQNDGYSTSPYYSQQLISLIEQYGLDKYDTAQSITQVDSPKAGQVFTSDVPVYGWAVAASGVKQVGVYLDNNVPIKGIAPLTARPDVNKIINSSGIYANALHSGYSCIIPRSMLTVGKHTVKVAGVAGDGTPCWSTVDFIVK
jgi:hypothetical protein